MNLPIKVDTKITYDDFKKFTWYTIFYKGKHIKLVFIIYLATVVFFLLFQLAMFLAVGSEGLSDTSIVLMISLVIIPPLFFLLINVSTKKNFKASKTYYDSAQHYEFSIDGIKVQTMGENVQGSGEYKYETFYRVSEVKDAFYLYINNVLALVIAKRDMDESTKDELATLLKNKLVKKYVKCY